jgi:hypothetical protein
VFRNNNAAHHKSACGPNSLNLIYGPLCSGGEVISASEEQESRQRVMTLQEAISTLGA